MVRNPTFSLFSNIKTNMLPVHEKYLMRCRGIHRRVFAFSIGGARCGSPHGQMRLSFGASESCYALRSALRKNKGREDDHMTVVVADMKRRSPTSATLPPEVNAFDNPAGWASQVCTTRVESSLLPAAHCG